MAAAGCQCLWRPLLSCSVVGQSWKAPGQRDSEGQQSLCEGSPLAGPWAFSPENVACWSCSRLVLCELMLLMQRASLEWVGGQMATSKAPALTGSSPLEWVRESGGACLLGPLRALMPAVCHSFLQEAWGSFQRSLLECGRSVAYVLRPHVQVAHIRTLYGNAICGYSTSSVELPMNGPSAPEGRV
eukprot:6491040-Amphidinium_carterae.1